MNEVTRLRWRLLLGRHSEDHLPLDGAPEWQEKDAALEFLYGREYSEERGMRQGNLGPSNLTVPNWISRIRELFPKQTVELLEKHALETYKLTELVTDPDVLRRLEPNIGLLKSILQLKHMMKGPVLALARQLVDRIVKQLSKELEPKIEAAFTGSKSLTEPGYRPSLRDLDIKRTIRSNMKHYDLRGRKLYIEKVYFHRRTKPRQPWHIITLVDQSGSMLDSVIHSAVLASIFYKLPMLRNRLVLFDTQIVDVTDVVDDPVQTLLSIQLGGGTNISSALEYAYGHLTDPSRTIVVLISDLCEGGSYERMYKWARAIMETRTRLVVLPSLDREAVPAYDKSAAEKLASMGAAVGAMTPEELTKWIRTIISRKHG